ncbi:ATP-dependent helicase [Bradyrhizobium sp. ORS 375]|uniref:DEAD/DEAH box helicase n=1 Tax=Bradyrhizobium sp. (strain ORS 375) TaxID=566679 RepID=UPI0002408AB8|nr:DEAD/DEAH box helicase [Bradyrhizobium sp. ORS 375]CCD90937.1 ATP-dependent helicase [Bradyrhizobium sp. ORS 375]
MSPGPDAIDRLSPAVRYQIANGLGWSGLRPVQALSTHAILDGANCVVLAPTAGGKTEAAFLPLLSKMDVEDWHGVSVLYVAPIRALLNNQEARLSKLTGLIGRRAGKWHGDVKEPTRKRLVNDPPDVLAITPESLEAMLLSTRTPARRFLAHVRAVVIDEVHAFAGDDRGAHLVSLLERISRIAETDIQRIGLSATVGDPDVIVRWLGGSSMRPQRVVDPSGARKVPDLYLDFVGTLDNAALLIERLYPGTRRLVFVDSRRRVEELGHRLSQRGVDVYLSHSSLALSERNAAEKAFEEGTNCVIVATSALELGIDVGDLDHVIQIDAPSSVSSFLQRMGRTGRRPDLNPNCTFLATDDDALLRAAAIIDLFRMGYVEPAAPSTWTPHVLAHQAIALAMQEQGSASHGWWNWLDGCEAYRDVSVVEREGIVRHMIENNILVEADARLMLGARGERLYGARNFLELYAVFSTPRVLRVMHGHSEVGVVDASFLQDKEQRGPNFVLAGRAWRISGVDWKGGTCAVEPAEAGSYPRWFGLPVSLNRSLCQAMRRILTTVEIDPSWSKRAIAQLQLQRESYAFLDESSVPIEEDSDGRCRWWTFGGGAGNRVLAGLLELKLGERVSSGNTFITFSNGAAASVVAIRQAIDLLAARPLTWEDASRLVDSNQRSRISKFQPCLPAAIEHGLIARETMNIDDANATVAQWKRGRKSPEG